MTDPRPARIANIDAQILEARDAWGIADRDFDPLGANNAAREVDRLLDLRLRVARDPKMALHVGEMA